ncbi:tetratricopeptide repeat protein [Hydrogenimonas sp.]
MLSLLLFAASLDALTINLKRGIESGHPFAVLHIEEKDPFRCVTQRGELGEPSIYLCRFDRMPESELREIENDFFHVSFKSEKGKFLCRIVPKKRSAIFPLPPPVYQEGILPPKPPNASRHWMILGFSKHPPYLGKKRRFEESINFPLDLSGYATPAVGAVDINGDPVFMKNNRDVERFIAIKEAFNAKKYQKAYDLATEAEDAHPDSIFASDFLRYRIKALAEEDMKEHAEEVIKLGKIFVKRYTSDEYLPEVLLILARVYSATGFESDANYFFDRLIQEHKGSRFADLGLIYLGDQLYINGKVKEAIRRYLEAYYDAKDLDVASLAAYKLAVRYFDRGKAEEAVKYLEKIWSRNPGFILKEKEDAHELARQLAAHKKYDLAIEIDRALLNRLKKLDNLYEEILFEIAEWYDEKGETKKAIEWYERYLDEFAYGEFSDKAKKNLDALFVVGSDANATEALEKYEMLMREYEGGPIADKALAAKAKVLYAQQRYEAVLRLAPLIEKIAEPDVKSEALSTLQAAARALFEEAVKKDRCKVAIAMVETYGVEPGTESDDVLYGCYEKYARYEEALKIARRHLNDPKPQERIRWLCRSVHVLTLSRRYEEALKAAGDLLALTEKGAKECPTLDWDRVRALHELGPYEKEIALVRRMSKRYGDDMRMAEVYRMAYDSAKKAGDGLQQKWLLERLIDLQVKKGSRPYTPWAEFEAIRLYKRDGAFKKALEVAETLKTAGLKGEKRARWLYEVGSLRLRLGEKRAARRSFEACIKVENGGAWGSLCKDALTLQ